MDVITLAATAVAALKPFLVKGGEEVASELSKQALSIGECMLKALVTRWRGKPVEEAKLAHFVSDPEVGRESLTLALVADLASDPAFAAKLQKVLEGDAPEVNVDLIAEDVGNLTGAELEEMVRGKLTVKADVKNAREVKGVTLTRLG